MAKTQKLKALIVERGMTQGELAKKINVDKGTLSRKINNNTTFSVEEAKKIANVLQISKEEASEIFFN